MAPRYSRFFRTANILGDLFLLNFAFYLVNTIWYNDLTVSFTPHYLKQFVYINLFWGVASSINSTYDMFRVMRIEKALVMLIRTQLLHLLLCFAFIVIFKEKIVSYRLYSIKYSVFIGLVFTWRIGFIYSLKFIRKMGLNFRNVIIVGTGPVALEGFDFFSRHPEHGYRFLGFFREHGEEHVLNKKTAEALSIDQVEAFCLENEVDEIYCTMSDVKPENVSRLMLFCDNNLIRFKLLPDFRGVVGKRLEINFYDYIPVLTPRKEPLENPLNRLLKRLFDIAFSLLVILIVYPWLLPLVALLIKLSSKGPVFFVQWRTGLKRKPFRCLKFRSMRTDFVSNAQASENDPRVTRIGRILRKTSIDEMPQFLNVLIGDMSIVGPRPHMIQHTDKYAQLISGFMVRHFVKPGITGLAQVSGFRGQTADPELMRGRIERDIWYLENWSLFFDVKIIFLTVFKLFKGDKNAV